MILGSMMYMDGVKINFALEKNTFLTPGVLNAPWCKFVQQYMCKTLHSQCQHCEVLTINSTLNTLDRVAAHT